MNTSVDMTLFYLILLHVRPLAGHTQHRRQRAVWLQRAILIAVFVKSGRRICENVSLNVTQNNIFGMQLLKIQWS